MYIKSPIDNTRTWSDSPLGHLHSIIIAKSSHTQSHACMKSATLSISHSSERRPNLVELKIIIGLAMFSQSKHVSA